MLFQFTCTITCVSHVSIFGIWNNNVALSATSLPFLLAHCQQRFWVTRPAYKHKPWLRQQSERDARTRSFVYIPAPLALTRQHSQHTEKFWGSYDPSAYLSVCFSSFSVCVRFHGSKRTLWNEKGGWEEVFQTRADRLQVTVTCFNGKSWGLDSVHRYHLLKGSNARRSHMNLRLVCISCVFVEKRLKKMSLSINSASGQGHSQHREAFLENGKTITTSRFVYPG